MIVAVDTGGTKTLIAGFGDDGQPKRTAKFPTPKDIDQYVQRVADQIHLIANNKPVTILSVALPGVVQNGIAKWCHNLGWLDVPIRELLAARFPETHIIVANDANMAGLASMHRLSIVPRCGLYITLGTGVGTALILDGKLERSLNDCEGGHMMLSWKGEALSWEEIASGRVFRQLFGELSDKTDLTVWSEIAERICVGLQPLTAFAQPDVVAIGGSVGPFVPYFADTLSGMLAEKLPAAISVPRIIAAPYPEEIVLYGCYDNALAYLKQN